MGYLCVKQLIRSWKTCKVDQQVKASLGKSRQVLLFFIMHTCWVFCSCRLQLWFLFLNGVIHKLGGRLPSRCFLRAGSRLYAWCKRRAKLLLTFRDQKVVPDAVLFKTVQFIYLLLLLLLMFFLQWTGKALYFQSTETKWILIFKSVMHGLHRVLICQTRRKKSNLFSIGGWKGIIK